MNMKLFVVAAVLVSVEAAMPRKPGQQERTCAKDCIAKDCKSALSLRWGKYCGMGHTGCVHQVKNETTGEFERKMEVPCDAYDACCLEHDECVGRDGMMSTSCHTALKVCLKKAIDNKEETFSDECKAEDLVNTMTQGMDLANIFSNSFNVNKASGKNVKMKPKKEPAYSGINKNQKKQGKPVAEAGKKIEEKKPAEEQEKQPVATEAGKKIEEEKPAEEQEKQPVATEAGKKVEEEKPAKEEQPEVKEEVGKQGDAKNKLQRELLVQEELLDMHMERITQCRQNIKRLKQDIKDIAEEL